MKRNQRILIALIILLIATFFRLWMFGDAPPGLQHDEIFKAEEGVRLIQQGDFRLFYPTNQGHEGAFVWILGLSYLITGINPLMIKLPAFIAGLLTVALTFRFGYRYYSSYVGILASGLTAVSFWAVFTSRVGLRAVTLPVVVLLVLIGLSTLMRNKSSNIQWRVALLTGLALGFAIYTYTSAFALHIAYTIFFISLWFIQSNLFQQRWRELIIVGVIGILLSLPMAYIRITDPQGTNRAESIATPLQEAQNGNPQPLIDNAFKLAGMPAFVGDPTWRYNIPGRPLFLLPIGLLVYLGLGLAIRQLRKYPLNMMLIGLALIGLIPSFLTVLAPSFLRSIVTLPSVMLFIGIAINGLYRLVPSQKVILGIMTIIIGVTAIADYQAYFETWLTSKTANLSFHEEREQGETVYEIYRDDLEQLAEYLETQTESVVFVSTPDQELDPLVYKFSGAPSTEETFVVFFNAFANIVLSEEPALLLVSPLSPISEKHQKWLSTDYGTTLTDTILRQDGEIAFEVYRVSHTNNTLADTLNAIDNRPVYITQDGSQTPIKFPVNFGDMLLFRGIEIPRETVFNENDGVNNQLYLEPLVKSSGATLQLFLHLIKEEGQPPIAQRDLLGVTPAYWHPNTIIVQDNFVPFWQPIPADTYQLVMGVYDLQTGIRLPILNETGNPIADHIILGEIEVITRDK